VLEIIIGILLIVCIIIFNILFLKKKGSFQYATKHIAVYSCLAVLIVCYLLFFEGLLHLKNRTTLEGIVENVISDYFVVVFIFFFYIFEKWLKSRGEDKEKLRSDYDMLAKKYNAEVLISRSNGYYYPVVKMGSFNLRIYDGQRMLGVDHIHIEDSQNMYKLPRIIENNFSVLMAAHDTSTLFNNKNIRVIKMEIHENQLFLTTERTFFYYSLVTNRAPDYEWDGITVRELFEPGPRLQPLELSELSNHLGINGFVESSDGYVVFVKRSGKVSIGKRTYGDSVGASIKAKYALNKDGFFTGEGLINAVLQEIMDELKIDLKNCSTVNLIGIYRDAVEIGKPQILFYAKTDVNAKEISKNFYEKTKSIVQRTKKKISNREKKRQVAEQKVLEDGSKLVWIKKDDLIETVFEENGIQVPEGAVFDYDYINGFFNSCKETFLPMVPSASASIRMLLSFFTDYDC